MLLVLAQVAIVAIALTVPAHLAWLRRQAEQLGLQAAAASGSRVAGILRGPTDQPELLVLAYHDVQQHPSSPYSVKPAQFADEMRMLADLGYTAATAADIDALMAGHPVPGRKVLITFDDGAKGIWTYADPVLARYRMHAMAFLIAGDIGTHQPYYVTWAELRTMRRSGRWDFESHTHRGHGLVPNSPVGSKGPFLASLEWRAAQHRYETMAEYSTRVRDDLAASKADMTAHGLTTPRYFAFPFSADGAPSNDPRVAGVLNGIIRDQFVAAFDNEGSAGPITAAEIDARVLARIEVTGQMSADTLFRRLHRVSPLTVTHADLQQASDWCCSTGIPNVTTNQHGVLRLLGTNTTGWRLSTYGPSRAAGWTEYRFTATGHGLSAARAAVALRIGSDGTDEIRIVMTATQVRLLRVTGAGGTTEIARHALRASDAHVARVTVTPAATTVLVDGGRVATLGPPSGGIGLGIHLTGKLSIPWFNDVTVTSASR